MITGPGEEEISLSGSGFHGEKMPEIRPFADAILNSPNRTSMAFRFKSPTHRLRL